MRLRLRPEIPTLSAVLIACSVYDESLLVDGDDTFEDSSLTSDTSSSGGPGPSAGSPSSSLTTQGSNVTNTNSGAGTMGGSEASGTGGATSDGSAATATTQGGANMSSSNGGTGGGSSSSSASTGGSPSSTDDTSGSGGSNGSGGTGAVTTDPLLIDNLNDGDGKLNPNYSGYWYFAMDTDDPDAEGEITAPQDTDTPRGVTTTPAREGSTRAMHAAGTWSGWGAALGFSFNQPDTVPIDGSVFSGVSFYARASAATTVRLEVVTEATYNNNNHMRAELSLTNAWAYKEVLWSELEEPDWDPDAPWEPETMLKVQFHFDNSNFDFWIDDVRFIE